MKPSPAFACALFALLACATLYAAAPPGGPDAGRVAALVRDLDDDDFFVRKKADDALRAMGKEVVPLLKAERERATSLEVKHRLDGINEALTVGERIATWVRLLNHANPQFREQADLSLRQAGATALPLLKRELKAELDGQCRARLEKIIGELDPAH